MPQTNDPDHRRTAGLGLGVWKADALSAEAMAAALRGKPDETPPCVKSASLARLPRMKDVWLGDVIIFASVSSAACLLCMLRAAAIQPSWAAACQRFASARAAASSCCASDTGAYAAAAGEESCARKLTFSALDSSKSAASRALASSAFAAAASASTRAERSDASRETTCVRSRRLPAP